jgi:carboxyl-terminal processing protease
VKKPLPEYKTEMGRTVYGGGGIVPDIELEEVKYPHLVEDLESKQTFFKYAVKYATKHKEPPANYTITPAMREEFVGMIKADKIEVAPDSLALAQHFIDTGMRRELARRYAGDEEAYRVALEDDAQVREAAALIDKAATLPKLLALANEMSKSRAAANPDKTPSVH